MQSWHSSLQNDIKENQMINELYYFAMSFTPGILSFEEKAYTASKNYMQINILAMQHAVSN